MVTGKYHFIREIESFSLDSYVPHLGWIGADIKIMKIYSKVGSLNFYLHDEIRDRLFEFVAAEPRSLKSSEEYKSVVEAYWASGW